jgi:hypothetical protein
VLSDQVRGLVDAEADLGECLVSAAAEQDVLACGVDVCLVGRRKARGAARMALIHRAAGRPR